MDIKNDMRKIIYGELSSEAIYNGVNIRCIFNDNSKIAREDEEGMVIDTVPSALCLEDDVSGVSSGDTVIVNSTSYKILEIFKMNGGIVKLLLTKGNLYD